MTRSATAPSSTRPSPATGCPAGCCVPPGSASASSSRRCTAPHRSGDSARSAGGLAAAAAEPCAGWQLCSASGTERLGHARPDRLAAARAELGPRGHAGLAVRALADQLGGRVEALDLIDAAQLRSHLLGGDLRLLRGGLLGEVGGAVL